MRWTRADTDASIPEAFARQVEARPDEQAAAGTGWNPTFAELDGAGNRVARGVLERTGGSFGPESAAALMDLGATVCLARVPRCDDCPLGTACPSRGRRYDPERRQSRFEGSFRQRRARTLRAVTEAARPARALDAEVVEALARDGLVEIAGGLVSLPTEPSGRRPPARGSTSGRRPGRASEADRRS